MSTNVYDLSYELEKGIRDSKEYTDLQALFAEMAKDEIASKMFENFREVQMKLQQKQMAGEQITQEEVDQAQKSFQLVQQNPTIAQLIEAEQRMSMMISELNKIIMKPLEDLYGMQG